jgi:hypothetical protein
MAMKNSAPSKFARGRYQLNLRSLVPFVTVACLVFGCAIWYLRPVVAFNKAAYQMRELAAPAPKGNPWLGPFMTTEVDYSEMATRLPENLLPHVAESLAGVSRHLETLPNLRVLNLRRLPIDDDDLQHLQALTDLEELDLRGTQVTEEGVEKLQRVLRNCKIEH